MADVSTAANPAAIIAADTNQSEVSLEVDFGGPKSLDIFLEVLSGSFQFNGNGDIVGDGTNDGDSPVFGVGKVTVPFSMTSNKLTYKAAGAGNSFLVGTSRN